MASELRHSPLEHLHRELGAKLGPFGGWLMPIEYAGTLSEHRGVRERVGLFDLSHLGKLDVGGPAALDALEALLTNEIASMPLGRARYALVLNDAGGIEEDLLVYRLASDRWFVVPNAAHTRMVSEALRDALGEGLDDHD